MPAAQDATLFGWLKTLYPIWARLNPEAIYTSALVGLAELMLTGCTTSSDHLYIYPNGARIDDEIQAGMSGLSQYAQASCDQPDHQFHGSEEERGENGIAGGGLFFFLGGFSCHQVSNFSTAPVRPQPNGGRGEQLF